MAQKSPGMLLVAAAILGAGVALAVAAVRVFSQGTPGMRFLGKLLGLAAFLIIMAGLACIVLAFGVDFR